MAHDTGQQLAFRVGAVFGMLSAVVGGRLDRRPRWRPQGIHASALVGDLRDVATFHQNGHTQIRRLDATGASASISVFRHSNSLTAPYKAGGTSSQGDTEFLCVFYAFLMPCTLNFLLI